jgi:hypothetical protein
MAGKHGWNDLENYLSVLLRVVSDHPFVVGHELQIEPIVDDHGEIFGPVFCHEDITVDVLKHFEVRRNSERLDARTTKYAYHAGFSDGRRILRYDSLDHHGFSTPHHRHAFEMLLVEDEDGQVSHVGDSWPHLSEVLDELQGMFWGGMTERREK